MKSLSVNQLVSEMKKAVCGKGESFGIALELSRAVELLAIAGYDLSDCLISYLSSNEGDEAQLQTDDEGRLVCKGIAAPRFVISAMDCFIASSQSCLIFEHLQNPLLSYGLMAIRQSPHFGSFSDESNQNLTTLLMQNIQPQATLHLWKSPYMKPEGKPAPARITMTQDAYDMLSAFAFKTYVPSSEQSRSAGAGAGLTDND